MTPLTPAEIAAIEERLDFWQRNDTVLDELTRLIPLLTPVLHYTHAPVV